MKLIHLTINLFISSYIYVSYYIITSNLIISLIHLIDLEKSLSKIHSPKVTGKGTRLKSTKDIYYLKSRKPRNSDKEQDKKILGAYNQDGSKQIKYTTL